MKTNPPLSKPPAAPTTMSALLTQAMADPAPAAISESGNIVTLTQPAPEAAAPTPEPVATAPSDRAVSSGAGEAITLEVAQPALKIVMEGADPNVITFFQIRMPETLKRKIEWLHAKQLGSRQRQSMHAIALSALEREVDRLIRAELKKG